MLNTITPTVFNRTLNVEELGSELTIDTRKKEQAFANHVTV